MAGGFLTRLKRRGQGLGGVDEVASILSHLRGLLNTRQGSSSLDPSYGLPDYTDMFHNFPRGRKALAEGVAQTVSRFEPRLRNVEVDVQERSEGDVFLHFVIRAQLASNGKPVQFDSSIASTGRVVVR